MRISSIDIGTNTVLLLIADTGEGKITRVIHDEQVIARLGKGVDEHRVINAETAHRVAEILSTYRRTCEQFRSEKILAVGTSALRDASNRSSFCDDMLRTTGITIELLSGEDEAEWTYRGGLSGLESAEKLFTVLDIGGGSTEIISGTREKIFQKKSLDLGCVRLTERFLRTSPPTLREISECEKFIQHQLGRVDLKQAGDSLAVGVAGTLTTLAAIDLGLPQYDPEKVNGRILKRETVRHIYNDLKTKKHDELLAIPQISPGRTDILVAGISILLRFMDTAPLETITVSDRGLRYGIVLRELAIIETPPR